jgi:hypothetical protein
MTAGGYHDQLELPQALRQRMVAPAAAIFRIDVLE